MFLGIQLAEAVYSQCIAFFSKERVQHRLRRGDTRELVATCLGTSVSTVKRVIRDHNRQHGVPFEVSSVNCNYCRYNCNIHC